MSVNINVQGTNVKQIEDKPEYVVKWIRTHSSRLRSLYGQQSKRVDCSVDVYAVTRA